MNSKRVLIVLGTQAAWSRGVLRGFMAVAQEHDWTLLHYDPPASLDWIINEWSPAAAVIGPEIGPEDIQRLAYLSLVSVTVDRSANAIASVCLDEKAISAIAFEHLRSTGLRQVSTFRYDESPFAVAREQAFVEQARAVGVEVVPGWGGSDYTQPERGERPAAMVAWLRGLPRPCGVFVCADSWGRVVARYAREAGLRVPEELALIGADNDELVCRLISPPLSSVIIPWQEVGREAASLIRLALRDQSIARRRVVVSPIAAVARRSTDVLAVDDVLVKRAVEWIHDHAERPLTVAMVARAVGGGRQRLERRFRRALDRTIQDEIHRAHVDVAQRALAETDANMSDIARTSGFTSASLLNATFRRLIGMPPGAYRRLMRKQ